MAFESYCKFSDMETGTLTDGLQIPGGGTLLSVASPANSPKVTNGLGIHANADNVSSSFYVVFPADLDGETTQWRMWIKFRYGSQVASYYNRARLIGRKSVPGTSDDSEIVSVAYSGSTYELSGDAAAIAWVQAGCVSDFYRNFYVHPTPSKLIYGYAGGLATGKFLTGAIHQDHGPRLYSNTGSDSATDYSIHDTMKEYAYNAVFTARTEPRFLRMRAFSFDLKNNDDYYIDSFWVRYGSIVPSDSAWSGPGIINVSSAIIGDNGAEYEGYIRFPSVAPKGIIFYEHPNNNTQWQGFHDDETKGVACSALLAAGYIICSQRGSENSSASHYKASNWGAPDGRTYRDAFIDYMAGLYPSLPMFCIGASMGFTNALVPLLRQTKNFLAIAGLSPVTNITRARDTEGFASVVNAGWENDWTAQKEANDPHLNLLPQRTGWMQRTPMLLIGDLDGDTTINQTLHGSALKDNLNAYGGSATFTDKDAANHLGNAVYDGASLLAFFNKFVSGGSGDFTMIPSADSYDCKRAGKVNVPVAIHRANHSAAVTFSLVSAPSGMTLTENSGITGSAPTLVLKCSLSVAQDTHEVTLRASDGTNVRDYPISIVVAGIAGGPTVIGDRSRRRRRFKTSRFSAGWR